jgi:phage portal protein BeeE
MGFWAKAFGLPEQRMITAHRQHRAPEREHPPGVRDWRRRYCRPVTIESALTVPAVWAAVSFLSRTLAALPLHAYSNKADRTGEDQGRA